MQRSWTLTVLEGRTCNNTTTTIWVEWANPRTVFLPGGATSMWRALAERSRRDLLSVIWKTTGAITTGKAHKRRPQEMLRRRGMLHLLMRPKEEILCSMTLSKLAEIHNRRFRNHRKTFKSPIFWKNSRQQVSLRIIAGKNNATWKISKMMWMSWCLNSTSKNLLLQSLSVNQNRSKSSRTITWTLQPRILNWIVREK